MSHECNICNLRKPCADNSVLRVIEVQRSGSCYLTIAFSRKRVIDMTQS